MYQYLLSSIPDLRLNGQLDPRPPNPLHASFPGVSGRALLTEATDAVAASVGSACHSERAADAPACAWRRAHKR
ncbi:MAG: hypothetical protein KJZ83_07670 [Burkholderiaceae bacterium]|nr:hypothetical protein [Burkholderiaceae bacterium]